MPGYDRARGTRRRAQALSTLALAGGPAIAVEPSGSPAVAWLRDFYGPAMALAEGPPEWYLRINESDAALRKTLEEMPADADLSACFASDRHLVELRTHRTASATLVDDMRRRCALRLSPPAVEVAAEEQTCRWRIVPAFIFGELTGARLRRMHLELHAAGVEVEGAGVAIVGPKRAGKTSLSLLLMRSGLCRHVCNDRAFAGFAGDDAMLWGVPTALTLPLALTQLAPELDLDGHWTDRPYLYTLRELTSREGTPRPPDVELWLGPHQLSARLGVGRCGAAPLRALVFPRFDPGTTDWRLTPMGVEDVAPGLLANIFGDAARPREATIFEALDGGLSDPPAGLAERLADEVPAFRLELGPTAWSNESFAADLLGALGLR